ncbi:hypothetical protein [Aliarcobacter cryaerophilus]|uniref:hypothetical protein n=1 Tax=Aliarcobacter cryaerophilus TaxID=28198 RepID=UPI0011DF46D6|nr:hypothetical protein [Aliarcobacter cryaerophilus]
MLPKVAQQYCTKLPKNKQDSKYQELVNEYIECGIKLEDIEKNIFLLQDERERTLKNMGVNEDTAFFDYCIGIFDYPKVWKGEELYGFVQILENYQSQNWLNLFPERVALKEKYPNAGERYLQFTSIEGEGSYFYDKETDYVYNVDWGQEEDMITGKLKPWFTSFYDFLEWYYSEDE